MREWTKQASISRMRLENVPKGRGCTCFILTLVGRRRRDKLNLSESDGRNNYWLYLPIPAHLVDLAAEDGGGLGLGLLLVARHDPPLLVSEVPLVGAHKTNGQRESEGERERERELPAANETRRREAREGSTRQVEVEEEDVVFSVTLATAHRTASGRV